MFRVVRAAVVGLIGVVVVAPAGSAETARASTGTTASISAASSTATASTGSITDRSRAFARINNYAYPRNKEVFKIRVDMRAGETRLIKSKLQVTANPKMTDSLVVVGHRLVCRPMNVADRSYYTITSRNVRRGATDTSYNSFFFTAPKTGAYVCETLIDGGRPKIHSAPTGDPGKLTNWSTITDSSWLAVGAPRSFARQSFLYRSASPAMYPGDTTRTFNQMTFRPRSSTERFHQTVYLTSCTSRSGSRDSVTDKDVCVRPKAGAEASVVVLTRVRAYDAAGRECMTRTAKQTRVTITPEVHHRQYTFPFSVDLSPSCRDRVQVTTQLGSVKGNSIMVHRQGMILRTD
jgi:hypothetical protein